MERGKGYLATEPLGIDCGARARTGKDLLGFQVEKRLISHRNIRYVANHIHLPFSCISAAKSSDQDEGTSGDIVGGVTGVGPERRPW